MAAILVIPAMILLVKTLISGIFKRSAVALEENGKAEEEGGAGIVLQPVLPGVNMPVSELGYYFVTLCICR